ncbi:phage tail protein [Halalkalibacterium halodurans]|uniref:phage tail protein n=1 Tax=Halalkalibacterium halodurans TaxID=86665 RepID=UPI002E1BA093|nr:phage tail protein [Halalkalibacterium halodurans]
MIKYNQLGRVRFNQLGRIRFNQDQLRQMPPLFNKLAGAKLVVYDQENRRLGVLENAIEPLLEQEINGVDELTFSIPFNDPKRNYIQAENIVEVVDSHYYIREVSKRRGSNGLEMAVYCEATWYDLQNSEPMEVWEWENATPQEIMADMLAGTEWNVGIVAMNRERNLQLEEGLTNRLEGLRELADVFNGELRFNSRNHTVDLLEPIGRDSGAAFVYRKNMTEVEADYSTSNLITKLYLYGKDGMTIEDAHPEGLPYIENYQFTKKKKVLITSDERFTNPYHLYDRGEYALNILSRPAGSYVLSLSDLSTLTEMSHEEFFLGDNVRVWDKELEINDKQRIMKWRYNIKRPWESEVELETTQPTISDLLTGVQDGTGFLRSEDTVTSDQMMNLSVFNLLLNSRADDGFNYWSNTGWQLDSLNGFSGNASFKATGTSGSKVLSQKIYPSHRENYAISFRGATENFQLNNNGRVGVEVVIKYTDGTKDRQFIPLA